MPTTYVQKQVSAQKSDATTAASVFDSSAQSESLQRKADMANNAAAQRAEAPRPNNTGMPDNLKAGIESLSGFSMDDVRVHYNSSKPATVQALAYTQGTDIHVAPGQEKCLPHEAWHVAQQMAGRVSPTTNINGMPVNDNAGLEHEADVMGEKAVQCKRMEERRLVNCCVPNNLMQCLKIEQKEKSGFVIKESKISTLGDLLFFACEEKCSSITIGGLSGSKRIFYENIQKIIDYVNHYRVDINELCDLPISECSTLKDVGDRVKDALTHDPTKEKYSLLPIWGCKTFTKDDLTLAKKRAFAESHGGTSFDDCWKKWQKDYVDETKRQNVLEKNIPQNAKKIEFFKYLIFFDKYISGSVDGKPVRPFNDVDDLIHQLAQDFILYNALHKKTREPVYRSLIGIHHQYSDYSSLFSKDSGEKGLRIYRSMPLDDFLNATLYGHGGPLGMALVYDTIPCVIVEFTLMEKVSFNEIGGGEGSDTKEKKLGRKSEDQSTLPHSDYPVSLNENGELESPMIKGKQMFSFNFGPKRLSPDKNGFCTNEGVRKFMNDVKVKIRVVLEIGIKDEEKKKKYDYMKSMLNASESSMKDWERLSKKDVPEKWKSKSEERFEESFEKSLKPKNSDADHFVSNIFDIDDMGADRNNCFLNSLYAQGPGMPGTFDADSIRKSVIEYERNNPDVPYNERTTMSSFLQPLTVIPVLRTNYQFNQNIWIYNASDESWTYWANEEVHPESGHAPPDVQNSTIGNDVFLYYVNQNHYQRMWINEPVKRPESQSSLKTQK